MPKKRVKTSEDAAQILKIFSGYSSPETGQHTYVPSDGSRDCHLFRGGFKGLLVCFGCNLEFLGKQGVCIFNLIHFLLNKIFAPNF